MKRLNLYYKYIIFIIIILIILYLSYYLINIFSNNFSNEEIYNEIICVGAGFSSAYICHKLKKENYNKNIIVLEKDNRIGGRLYSVYSDENKTESLEATYNELGGMRLFSEEAMKKVFDLLKELKLETIPVGLKDNNNIFYYKGEHLKKKDVILSNGMTIEQMKKVALENVKQEFPNFTYEKVFEFPEIVKLNAFDFYKKYAFVTDEDVEEYIAYDGYNYLTKDVSIAVHISIADWYTSNKSDQQVYVKDGIVTLVHKLFNASNAKIKLDTTVMYVEKDNEDYNILHTITKEHIYKRYKCKYLFLGVTSKAINELNIIKRLPISNERQIMINEIKLVPLMKVFLKWDKNKLWWREKGFKQGKSTTDLEARMIHYYNDEDLLVYTTGKYANSLNLKFLENPAAATKYVFSMVQKVHPFPIPEPNYVYTLWKYWPDGASRWKTTANVKLFEKVIPNGSIDKSNIYIAGDPYSKYQGWIIGCVETADTALTAFSSVYNK